jgi:hypothetical protein
MSSPGSIHPGSIGKFVVLTILSLLVMFALAMILSGAKPLSPRSSENVLPEQDLSDFQQELVIQAKKIYLEKKQVGVDFSSGPCLAEDLVGEYVVDLAHNPREAIDSLPENQCLSYSQGAINHFIELDLEGNLIRIK